MQNKNIVIFSSGVSEQNGITLSIKNTLNQMGYVCVDWRGLFSYANHTDNIALLPMLVKKIPTFDFAVLICEGHDLTYISRGEQSETVKTMRDNVLFEIGLCAMAIGLNRIILVTDGEVHLPDDLQGTNGRLAVKRIVFSNESLSGGNGFSVEMKSICESIDAYIRQEEKNLNQIVIGAAASGACGYASNFICRLLEHIDDEMTIADGDKVQALRISRERVYVHVILPNNMDESVLNDIRNKKAALLNGTIQTARNRPISFHCRFVGEELHVIDYPTNVVTSYDTARIILGMDADDAFDDAARDRFVVKEMALYEATLQTILNESFVRQVLDEHYSTTPEDEKERMLHNVLDIVKNRFTVSRYE